MLKLFQVSYMQDMNDGSYLTVGDSLDTEEIVTKRELNKFGDTSCLYFFNATEITEVEGHKIIVQE